MGEVMKSLAQIQHAMLVNQIDKIVKPNLKTEESFKGISQVQKNYIAKRDEVDAQENYIETLPENDPRRQFALEKLEELKAVRDDYYGQAMDALDSIINEKDSGFLNSICQLILNFHYFGEETVGATEKKKERFEKMMKKGGGEKKKAEKKQETAPPPEERKSKARPPTTAPPPLTGNEERKSKAKPPTTKPPPLDEPPRKKSDGPPPRPSNDGKTKLIGATEEESESKKSGPPPRPSNDTKPSKVETPSELQSKFAKFEKKEEKTEQPKVSTELQSKFSKFEKKETTVVVEEQPKPERKLSTFQMNQQKIGGLVFDPNMLRQSKQFQKVEVVKEKVEVVKEKVETKVEEVIEQEPERVMAKHDSKSKMLHRLSMITDPLLKEKEVKKQQFLKSPEPKMVKKSIGDAIVLYDYDPQDKTEISLKEGDVVKIYKKNGLKSFISNLIKSEDDWWVVGLDSREGLFPANFLSEETKTKALYSYNALEDGELSFKEGEFIKVLKKNGMYLWRLTFLKEDGWWVGELKNKVGLFPVNYTEIGQ